MELASHRLVYGVLKLHKVYVYLPEMTRALHTFAVQPASVLQFFSTDYVADVLRNECMNE